GSGYGVDGQVWGGEFLVADLAGFERAGHFESVPMPGGDAAVREPWRMAAVFLRAAYGETMETLDLAFIGRLWPACSGFAAASPSRRRRRWSSRHSPSPRPMLSIRRS